VSPLSLADRNLLLALARRSIEVALVGSLAPPERFEGALGEPRGAFVTLKRREDDELRGCIGRIEAREPLGVTVAHVAVAAATEDPRFPPLSPHELPGVRIEVSILTPPERIVPGAVQVGLHGLIVRLEGSRGLLLPQVAVEHEWDRETFLAETCRKARLPLDAWKDPEATLLAFTAEVLREE